MNIDIAIENLNGLFMRDLKEHHKEQMKNRRTARGHIEPIIDDKRIIGHQYVSPNHRRTFIVGSRFKNDYSKSKGQWNNNVVIYPKVK